MKPTKINRWLIGLILCAGALLCWRHPQFQPATTASPHASIAVADPSAVPPAKLRAAAADAPENFQCFTDPDRAPLWAVPYGKEFWRREAPQVPAAFQPATGSPVVNPPFNLADVIERVDHALAADETAGAAQLDAGNYAARFDAEGLHFSPSRPAETPAGRPAPDAATQIHFRTASIDRDGELFFSSDRDATEWSVVGNTAQGLLSRDWGMVEHYETTGEGVAVTWVFPRPLPGFGAIEITANVDGLAYAGETEAGYHFADQTGAARVRVGEAFAVDAIGNKWELAMQAAADRSGRLFVELPADIQAEAVYPLVVDPVIGPEFGMDAPVSAVASGTQINPGVAALGTNFLVVWEDVRNLRNTGRDIYGVRVSRNGAILDPFGIAICTAPGDQLVPVVASAGKTNLVVWRDQRAGSDTIFGARVSFTGAVLDPLGLALSVSSAQEVNPAIAATAAGYFVAWEDLRNNFTTGHDIYGTRVSPAGTVLDPFNIAVSTANFDQITPTVATNGTGYFVAWEDRRNNATTGRDVYGARVSSGGVLLDTNGVALSTALNNQTEPAVAANNDTVLVAWRDQRTADDLMGTLVNFTNNAVNVFDTNGFTISAAASTQRSPAICALSTNFLVVWRDRRTSGATGDDIYAARVDAGGNVLDAAGVLVCNDVNNQQLPAVASGTNGAFAVWNDNRGNNSGADIFGARIGNDGVVADTNGFAVSLGGADEVGPVVAFNGAEYLVAWQDDRNDAATGTDIRGARVSSAGALLDLAGIVICNQAANQFHPSVGASGGEFLVAWEDERNAGVTGTDIYAARVSSGGGVVDPAGIAVSTAANDEVTPAVAGNASTFLVAWEDNRKGSAPDIFGNMVSQGGLVSVLNGFPISDGGDNEINPAVAASPDQFLVALEDASVGDVFAVRVLNNGTVLDPTGSALQLADIGNEFTPSVAAVGTNFLVAWADDRNFTTDIFATRVFADGTVPDFEGFAVSSLPGNQTVPAVSATTNTWVVAWQNPGLTDGNTLYYARVSTAGTVQDLSGVPLVGAGDRAVPRLAFGAGKFLLVSEAFRSGSVRVAGNLISADPALVNPTIQFSAANYSVGEAGKFAKISVSTKTKFTGLLTVDFSTADGTAVAGVDYLPVIGRLTFAPKKLVSVVLVPIIDDLTPEPNKTVILNLSNPTGGVTLGPVHTATLTIIE